MVSTADSGSACMGSNPIRATMKKRKILVCAATEIELQQLRAAKNELVNERNEVDFAVLGIGITETSINLSRLLFASCYDLVISVGIAGAYNRNQLKIGEVVEVIEDFEGDLGIDDRGRFRFLDEIGINDRARINRKAKSLTNIRAAKGITVQTVSGSIARIEEMRSRGSADIESMEISAVMRTCEMANVELIVLRGISNYVEERNRSAWDIDGAVRGVSQAVIACLR